MGVGGGGGKSEETRAGEIRQLRAPPRRAADAAHSRGPPVFPPPHSGQLTSRPGGERGFMSWTVSFCFGMHRLPPRKISTRCKSFPRTLFPRKRNLGPVGGGSDVFSLAYETTSGLPVGCPEPGHLQPLVGLQLCLCFSLIGFFCLWGFFLSLASFHPGRALVADAGFWRGDMVRNPQFQGLPA